MGIGWYSPYSGYGVVNLEYATALNRLTGDKVTTGWERYTPEGNPFEWKVLSEEQRAFLSKPYEPARVGIIKTTPPHFYHNESKFRVGYSMVENTRIGEDWVKYCNKMDVIFVPSPFLINVFKECGVTRPIYSVRQGVDPLKYPYKQRKPFMKYKPFIFGTVGDQDERKNWTDLVTAFISEFEPHEQVELWIKNTNPKFGNFNFSDERIKIINTYYSFEELMQLYHMFDCFVFPSRAEGSGMPPKEAMSTGLPCIFTNWSGLEEVANMQYNYPLTPISIDYPDSRGPEQPGMQARIDVTELMFWMRHVYENQDAAFEKGKLASEWMAREWNWDACAREMLSIIETF